MIFYTILTVHEYLGHFLTIKGKKVGEYGSKKVCPKWVTQYLAYPHEKCSKWKSTVSSNDYGVPKNFSPFKRKKYFLTIFVILEKITKMAKSWLFLLKGGNFFSTPLSFGKTVLFLFLFFFIYSKKIKKDTFFTFFGQKLPFFQLWGPKSP